MSGITYSAPSGASSGGVGHIAGILFAVSSGTKYRTLFGYDVDGREYLVARDIGITTGATLTTPQITITAYDSLGRSASVWSGTDSSGWTSPASPGGNMTEIAAYQYDNNSVGDGNLTQTTQFPGDGSPNRVTQTDYDFRDRAVLSEQGRQVPRLRPPADHLDHL